MANHGLHGTSTAAGHQVEQEALILFAAHFPKIKNMPA
jgi:hypothetical protein